MRLLQPQLRLGLPNSPMAISNCAAPGNDNRDATASAKGQAVDKGLVDLIQRQYGSITSPGHRRRYKRARPIVHSAQHPSEVRQPADPTVPVCRPRSVPRPRPHRFTRYPKTRRILARETPSLLISHLPQHSAPLGRRTRELGKGPTAYDVVVYIHR
jgi:hypothetical protein